MARRSDIDWEAIGRDYCAGQSSIMAVAKTHGVSDSQLRARARREGWLRDLSVAIAARTKAKLAAIDVNDLIEQSATESAGKSVRTMRAAIEKASDVAAAVGLRHRAQLADSQRRAESIEALLDKFMASDAIRDVGLLATTFKALVEARARLIDKERQAHGMEPAGATEFPYEQTLRELRKSREFGAA